ncbi:hypothetical protein M407DRAFT_6566 [Tulasnella calospora MUT 4182]|uniref:Uncharacterized protein n=1 Tax=Tulasnella calospora MUT 4182 TaxID=1051891 RepID=A0A0C3QD38_9AGAM|nr:hypothetical protein M407DRAFT_6566 [Tulasnella calospora MUT 4182]
MKFDVKEIQDSGWQLKSFSVAPSLICSCKPSHSPGNWGPRTVLLLPGLHNVEAVHSFVDVRSQKRSEKGSLHAISCHRRVDTMSLYTNGDEANGDINDTLIFLYSPISISTASRVTLNHTVIDLRNAIANLNLLQPQLHGSALRHWWRKISSRLMEKMLMVYTCLVPFLTIGLALVGRRSVQRRRAQYEVVFEPGRAVVKYRAPKVANRTRHRNAIWTRDLIKAGPQKCNAVPVSDAKARHPSSSKPAEIPADMATTTVHHSPLRTTNLITSSQTLGLLPRPEPEAQEALVQSEDAGDACADQEDGNRVEASFVALSGSRSASSEPEISTSNDDANIVDATLIPLPNSPLPSVHPFAASSYGLNRRARTYQLVANLYQQHAAARAMEREPVGAEQASAIRSQMRARLISLEIQAPQSRGLRN